MTTTPQTPGSRGEAGFTLVELLVTMTLALVVLLAVLQGADHFRSTSEASSRRTDVQEQLRRTLRTVVTELREAPAPTGAVTPLANTNGAVVSSSDLVVHTTAGWTRYCAVVGANDRGTLYRSQSAALPTGACGSGGAVAIVRDRLRDAGRLFAYTTRADLATNGCAPTSTSPCLPPASEVRGVGVRIAIAPDASTAPLVSTSAVSLRNRTP